MRGLGALLCVLLLGAGCGAPERLPPADAGTDAGIDVADHCAWQPATLDDFVQRGTFAARYAGAFGAQACAPCGAWLVVGDPGPYVLHD